MKKFLFFIIFLLNLIFSFNPPTYPMQVEGNYDINVLNPGDHLVDIYVNDIYIESFELIHPNGYYDVTFGGYDGKTTSFRMYGYEVFSFVFNTFTENDNMDFIVTLAQNGESCTNNQICNSGYCANNNICSNKPAGGGVGGGTGTTGGAGGAGVGGAVSGIRITNEVEYIEIDEGLFCRFSVIRSYQIDSINNWTRLTTTITNDAEENNVECDLKNFKFIDKIPNEITQSFDSILFIPIPNERDEANLKVTYIIENFKPQTSFSVVYRFDRADYDRELLELIFKENYELDFEREEVEIIQDILVNLEVVQTSFENEQIKIRAVDSNFNPISNLNILVRTPPTISDDIHLLTNVMGEVIFIASRQGLYTYEVQTQGYVLSSSFSTNVLQKEIEKQGVNLEILDDNFEIGELIRIKATYENGSLAQNIEIRVRAPDGKIINLFTDSNGLASFLIEVQGEYSITTLGENIQETRLSFSSISKEEPIMPIIPDEPEEEKEEGLLDMILPIIIGLIAIVIIVFIVSKLLKRKRKGL